MLETVVQELAGYGVDGLHLAIKIPRFIRDMGAAAGFAAVIGLAVLSALYFSQARDVRRLREWAGRAPERAAEEEERLQAAARAAAAAAETRAAAGAQPAADTAEEPATAARTPAGAAAAAGAAGGEGQRGGVATAPPRITPRFPSQQTAVLAQTLPSGKRPRWYRRINWPAPRYIALIVVGILVVGGGAAFGVTKLLEDEPASEQAGRGGGGGGSGDKESTAPIDPADVKVSVLNGTVVQGLAAQIGDTVRQKGFQLINVANATEQQRAESVVMYTEDANREARAVARRLDISQIEPADEPSRSLAGDATVIVVVGADQTR